MASPSPARASSHMDAPLIILDDAANTTDVYAFLERPDRSDPLPTSEVRVVLGWRGGGCGGNDPSTDHLLLNLLQLGELRQIGLPKLYSLLSGFLALGVAVGSLLVCCGEHDRRKLVPSLPDVIVSGRNQPR